MRHRIMNPKATSPEFWQAGQTLKRTHQHHQCIYQVIAGELMILVNGYSIDLIEAGEYLDERIWNDGVVVQARTDCELVLLWSSEQPLPKRTICSFRDNPEVERLLALAA